MNQYYDYHPPRIPEIPIALVGFFGSGHLNVGRSMAARTALPYIELDRHIEHDAGMNVVQLIHEEGENRYREIEFTRLQAGLRSKPAGIITLGEGSIQSPRNLALVLKQSVLVHIHRDPEELNRRLQEQQQLNPTTAYPWLTPGNYDSLDLTQLHNEHLDHYEQATLRFDATGRSSDSIAGEILKALDLAWPGA